MLWAPVSTYAPFRSSGRLVYQVGEPWDQPGITLWSANGYNYTDVRAYDKALTTILTLPGTAMEWRVADSQYPLYFIYDALNSLLGNEVAHTKVPRSAGRPTDFVAAMDAMTTSLRVVRDNLGAAAFREQLWGTTGFVPPAQPPQPAPPSPTPAGSPGLTTPVLVTVIAVPVAVCSLLVLLLAVIITHLRRNAKLQRSLMGHVLPPAAGDKATLVITDVQGSSKLWETMPAGVMDVSMKLHDELVRRLALDSSGYEWATEGDSFLLCFHSPQAAVTFVTQLQDALLRCSQWPVELAAEGSPSQPLCLAPEVEATMPAALTVLAGLRGLHTGLAADEVLVQRRMGASSITYGGAALVLAKAVQACAHGGQVTLSAATFVKLPVEELRAAGISVVHMGQHLVALGEGKGATALELYCACLNTPDHAHRLWALGPLRTLRQMQPGVLHAPYGTAAIAFMSVVGLSHLKAWNAELAKECVALYQAAAQRLLLHVSGPQLPAGYWVSSAEEEGMVLAAFPCSLQCLHWALLTLTTCMDMDWPQALLDSLFGEEMTACLDTSGSKAGVTQAPATGDDEGQQQTAAAQGTVRLLRGLRLKVGVDVGEVACDLTPANGRFNYRGRCLNRAARINGLAVSGQVWCSESAWANTLAALQPIITTKEARALASLAADQPAASTASWSAQGSKQAGSSIARSTHSSTAQPKRVVSFQPAAAQGRQEVELVTGPAPGPAVLDVSHPPPQEPSSSGSESSVTAQWHAAQQQLHSSTQAGSGAGGEGAERPSASLLSQGQPLRLPGLLPPLVARPLGKRELRGIPGQVALLQVALAPHTSRAQLEAADRLGLSAPGLQLSRPQQPPAM
ncbi:nucleotide cyclase [Haematococcus lacustris]